MFIIKEYIYTDCDILAYLSLRGYSAKKKNHLRQVRFADYSEMSLGFDLIRCDEANRSGDNCHEGRSSYFQLPRNRRHGTQGHAGKHLGQSRGREGRGKCEHKPVFWLLWEKQGRAAGLASLNNFSGLSLGYRDDPKFSGMIYLGQRKY